MTDPDKIDWFNNLPSCRTTRTGLPWMRTCPCGAEIWYETANDLKVSSWTDIHFGHQAMATEEPTESQSLEYDFTKPIKFSRAGFREFLDRFGLEPIENNSGSVYEYFMNHSTGSLFAFYPSFNDKAVKNDFEGVYATFEPKMSEVGR